MTVKTFLGAVVESPVGLIDNHSRVRLEFESKKINTISGTGQRWDVEFQLSDPLATERLAAKLIAHQARFAESSFDFPVLQAPGVDDLEFIGSISVRTNTVAGSKSVPLRTSVGSFVIPEGYFIQFSTGKVYVTTSSARITTTAGTIGIYPSLRTNLTTAAVVVLAPTMQAKWGEMDSTGATRITQGVSLRSSYLVNEAV